ncbi:hypothetical protein TH30_19350 [Thalassospira profundimaris]|uniref:Uncharacterized protein n=1 Tax=Thalassospira profundimaris TaxID=502049 RepID=A0A367WRE0_9PROT|nr:hypothetical protein TH30_19350 [Thalassospira profundimaris]
MIHESVDNVELIKDACYAISKLEEERVSLRVRIGKLETDIYNMPVPPIPREQELREMSPAEKDNLFQARADREEQLNNLQGSRKRLQFVEQELLSWRDRIRQNR